jgi:hypothetical protein
VRPRARSHEFKQSAYICEQTDDQKSVHARLVRASTDGHVRRAVVVGVQESSYIAMEDEGCLRGVLDAGDAAD